MIQFCTRGSEENIDQAIAQAHPEAEWLCMTALELRGDSAFEAAVHGALRESREPVLILGEVSFAPGAYPGLYEKLFLLHMPTFRSLGAPKFGACGAGPQRLQNFLVGPGPCLMPLGYFEHGWIDATAAAPGWGFVNASMWAGLRVLNLPPALRPYIYRDDPGRAHGLDLVMDKRPWTLVNPRATLASAHRRVSPGPVDGYVGPCSGLLEFAALSANGFHAGTTLLYFDVDAKAMANKKLMFERFDGKISTLRAKAPRTPESEESLAFLLEVFGTENALAEFWNDLRRLPRKFVRLNLNTDVEKLLANLDSGRRTLLLVDEIFSGESQLVYGQGSRRERREALLHACDHHANLRVLLTQ